MESLENDEALQQISGREVRTVVENGREITVPVVQNPIDFAELEKVNEDTVGWIRISALDISYPVVQGKTTTIICTGRLKRRRTSQGVFS